MLGAALEEVVLEHRRVRRVEQPQAASGGVVGGNCRKEGWIIGCDMRQEIHPCVQQPFLHDRKTT